MWTSHIDLYRWEAMAVAARDSAAGRGTQEGNHKSPDEVNMKNCSLRKPRRESSLKTRIFHNFSRFSGNPSANPTLPIKAAM